MSHSRKPISKTGLRIFYLFLPLCLLSISACSRQTDWLHYRGEKGHGYTPTSILPPLGRRWKLLLQKKPTPAKYFNPPIVKGDTLYFGSGDNNFYAFDINSGYQLWSFKTKAPVNSIPSIDEERVYFGSNDGNVYALDRKNGEKIWSFNTGKTVQSLVLRYEDQIIFTSDLGRMYFLDLDGKLLHSVPNPYWMHHTFQIYDNILYWAPKGINFAAYDIKNRKYTKWIEKIPEADLWYSIPAVDETNVYFGISILRRGENIPQLSFRARTRDGGEAVWEQNDVFRFGDKMKLTRHILFRRHMDLLDYLAPALWKDLIVFSAGDTTVRAFHRDTGEPAWEKTFAYPTSSAPTIAGDRIYLGLFGEEDAQGRPISGGQKPRLVSLSAATGELLWELELEGTILSAPVISGKRLMFGTNDYHFHVLEEIF